LIHGLDAISERGVYRAQLDERTLNSPLARPVPLRFFSHVTAAAPGG